MNQIYLLYSCDAWKSHTSMNLLMAAVAAYSADPDTRTLSFGYLESVGDGERL